MILWGETLSHRWKYLQWDLRSCMCRGRETHHLGRINGAPCWAAAGITPQQVCRIWATCLCQIPVLLPASCPCFWQLEGLPRFSPWHPAAVRGLQGAPLPLHKRIALYGKGRAWLLGMDSIHVPNALGLGNAPVCPAKQCTEPSPGTALLSARVDFCA